MRSNGGTTTPHGSTAPGIREQYVWFHRFGYVRIRDLVRVAAIVFVVLTAIVTLLTNDLVTLVFLGILALVTLRFASFERYIDPGRRVTVFADGGLYVAEHVGSGKTRHGATPEEALTSLRGVI